MLGNQQGARPIDLGLKDFLLLSVYYRTIFFVNI